MAERGESSRHSARQAPYDDASRKRSSGDSHWQSHQGSDSLPSSAGAHTQEGNSKHTIFTQTPGNWNPWAGRAHAQPAEPPVVAGVPSNTPPTPALNTSTGDSLNCAPTKANTLKRPMSKRRSRRKRDARPSQPAGISETEAGSFDFSRLYEGTTCTRVADVHGNPTNFIQVDEKAFERKLREAFTAGLMQGRQDMQQRMSAGLETSVPSTGELIPLANPQRGGMMGPNSSGIGMVSQTVLESSCLDSSDPLSHAIHGLPATEHSKTEGFETRVMGAHWPVQSTPQELKSQTTLDNMSYCAPSASSTIPSDNTLHPM